MNTAGSVTARCGPRSKFCRKARSDRIGMGGFPVRNVERLCLAHFWVAFAAFLVASLLGAWQMWVRSPLGANIGTPSQYFLSATAHGVAMAVVTILTGQASVLFTFYPPLTASPWFYIGLVLVVIASWVWCVLMLVAMQAWKRETPGRPVPLAMFATVANAVMWLWTTVGVAVELLFQVIPAAFGWIQTVDVGLARTLFSWTLHAIVYFWLIPAYIAFYTMVPRAAGGRLYSDTMGRLTFILFLLYSLPVGMHHLLMDPEHGTGTKFVQVLLTAFVSVPPLLTIFTITASLEIARRAAVGTPDGARGRPRLRHAGFRRFRRADQHGLRHERDGAQHIVGHRAFPPHLRRLGRDHVFRNCLRDLAALDRARISFA